MSSGKKFTGVLLATVFAFGAVSPSVEARSFGDVQLGNWIDKAGEAAKNVGTTLNQNNNDKDKDEDDKNTGNNSGGRFGLGVIGNVIKDRFAIDMCDEQGSAIQPLCQQLVRQSADLLGTQISSMLTPKDQKKVVVASEQALETGKPVTVDLPDSQATTTIRPVTKPKKQTAKVPVVVAKDTPIEKHQFEVDLNKYQAKSATNLHAGPASGKPVIGAIKSKEVVSVIGTVVGKPWLLVDRGGVAAGYAPTASMKTTKKKVTSKQTANRDTEVVDVAVITNCGTQEITVTSQASGETASTTKTVCESPNGGVITL